LSLAELIVSLALFSIVMAGVATLIRETVRFYNVNLVGIDVQRESIFAMNTLREDLADASFSNLWSETQETPTAILSTTKTPANLYGTG
jgi:type II secretory pathway component PulJ